MVNDGLVYGDFAQKNGHVALNSVHADKAGLHPWSAGRLREHFIGVEDETANRSELSLSIEFFPAEVFECGSSHLFPSAFWLVKRPYDFQLPKS